MEVHDRVSHALRLYLHKGKEERTEKQKAWLHDAALKILLAE
ncbi:hypothetical protein [Pontibacter saemangeumensis]